MKAKSLPMALACLAVAFLAAVGVSQAEPRKQVLYVTTGSTASDKVAQTNYAVRGAIDSVTFDVPAGSPTGNVSLATLSDVSTEASVTLASTNSITEDTPMRPRWLTCNYDGTAAGTVYDQRFSVMGEGLIFSVTNASATGKVWRCIIKYDDN